MGQSQSKTSTSSLLKLNLKTYRKRVMSTTTPTSWASTTTQSLRLKSSCLPTKWSCLPSRSTATPQRTKLTPATGISARMSTSTSYQMTLPLGLNTANSWKMRMILIANKPAVYSWGLTTCAFRSLRWMLTLKSFLALAGCFSTSDFHNSLSRTQPSLMDSL